MAINIKFKQSPVKVMNTETIPLITCDCNNTLYYHYLDSSNKLNTYTSTYTVTNLTDITANLPTYENIDFMCVDNLPNYGNIGFIYTKES